jgi:hypothetical protein
MAGKTLKKGARVLRLLINRDAVYEIQYNNEMVENLTRTVRQNTERIEEIWNECKGAVEQLANSVGKRIDVVPNEVYKRVSYVSNNFEN